MDIVHYPLLSLLKETSKARLLAMKCSFIVWEPYLVSLATQVWIQQAFPLVKVSRRGPVPFDIAKKVMLGITGNTWAKVTYDQDYDKKRNETKLSKKLTGSNPLKVHIFGPPFPTFPLFSHVKEWHTEGIDKLASIFKFGQSKLGLGCIHDRKSMLYLWQKTPLQLCLFNIGKNIIWFSLKVP